MEQQLRLYLQRFNKSDAAISLAFVHLLFNLIGVLLFLPFPVLRRLPIKMAYRFGKLTLGSRIIGFSYIIVTFFLLPFALISLSGNSSEEKVFEFVTESSENTSDTTRVIMNSTKGFDIISIQSLNSRIKSCQLSQILLSRLIQIHRPLLWQVWL